MTLKNPNLARRPFVNRRPVVRTSALLWAVGVLLLAFNVNLYWDFSRGQGQTRTRLEEVRSQIETTQASIRELEDRLGRVDLERQNEQVTFLNRKIQERIFGWSVLFETLTDVLPRDVRLQRLSPQSLVPENELRAAERAASEEVRIEILGEARTFEAVLELVDALYASAAFEDPDITRDAKARNGLILFSLDVRYFPQRASSGEEAPEGSREREAAVERAIAGPEAGDGSAGEEEEPADEGRAEDAGETREVAAGGRRSSETAAAPGRIAP